MAVRRHHADILIAGLALVGLTGWMGTLAFWWLDSSWPVRTCIWFVSAFFAARLARLLVEDLDLGELAIAALITQLVVFGIHAKRNHVPIDAGIVVAVGVSEAGALCGALASKYRTPVALTMLVTGAGAVGFGVAVLCVGVAMLFGRDPGSGVIAGAVVGGIVFVAFVPGAKWWHCALGPMVFYAAIIAVFSTHANHAVVVGLATMFTMVLGAVGGLIGRKIRNRMRPETELPEARQIHEHPPR